MQIQKNKKQTSTIRMEKTKNPAEINLIHNILHTTKGRSTIISIIKSQKSPSQNLKNQNYTQHTTIISIQSQRLTRR